MITAVFSFKMLKVVDSEFRSQFDVYTYITYLTFRYIELF
jgi:hypothetical protein